MKKLLCILVVIVLCMSVFSACTQNAVNPSAESTETPKPTIEKTPTPTPTPEPSPTPDATENFEIIYHDISFEVFANYSLSDYMAGLQEPFINQNGGYTFMIDENHLFAFILDDKGNILEANYTNLNSFDSTYPKDLPNEELMYIGCLYTFMLGGTDGLEDFFNGIKLIKEDETSAEHEVEFGGYKIVFKDIMLMRTFTITPVV